ncbi:sensor histidine kinase [Marinomonas sp. PE14-40]|uniref:sensor histidine kinase n=1 Tax=Marinomonas sp. PE14-40 TaxID=3060621 RepID=UPI003F660E99
MRSLVISLYILVLGCMFLISLVVEQWGESYYKQETGEEYLAYSQKLTPLIEKDILENPQDTQDILRFWSDIIEDDPEAIQIIELGSQNQKNTANLDAYIVTLDITDQTDHVLIISPLKDSSLQNKAISFTYYDSFSDSIVIKYYIGRLIIYTFMTLTLTLIAWLVYRYINQISQVAKSVSAGRFDLKMPNSRIQALQNLATDINNMAASIEEKNNENLILTGAIHHELRIPITRIRLALDMLIQMKQDTTSLELLADMDQDLEELSSLMEELLTISRLRLRGVELDKEDVSLSNQLISLTQKLSNAKVHLNTHEDLTLQANQTLLDRALINIINNGIKYSDTKLVISTRKEENLFILTFEDDGIGIPENERDMILKPFYRTDKSRNRNTGGFGLGLAIADLVIKDCQGQIKIAQSPLGGVAISIHWHL